MTAGFATEVDRALAVASAMPEGGLFHEKSWRVSPRAFPVSPRLADELDKLGYRIQLFVRACNLLYRLSVDGKQPSWIARLLDAGKPPELVALSREKRFRDHMPEVLRPDLILTADGFAIAELDNVPGGIGLTAWLSRTYSAMGEDIVGGPDGMLEGFASILPGGDIVVSDEAATYRPEMEWLAAELNLRHPESRWCVLNDQAQDWQPRVYRFFELFDLPNVRAARVLQERSLSGEIRVTPPWKPALEEKLWFALFWLKPLREFWRRELSERQFFALRKVIPYSWIVDPAPLPPHAVLPRLDLHSWDELAKASQKERELVLKVSGFSDRAWGSRGVTVGSDVSQAQWREELRVAVEEFGKHPRLLQEFRHSAVFEHPVLSRDSDAIETMRARIRLCPYYFVEEGKARLRGALATLVPPDKKLIHGMSESVLIPAAYAPG